MNILGEEICLCNSKKKKKKALHLCPIELKLALWHIKEFGDIPGPLKFHIFLK